MINASEDILEDVLPQCSDEEPRWIGRNISAKGGEMSEFANHHSSFALDINVIKIALKSPIGKSQRQEFCKLMSS